MCVRSVDGKENPRLGDSKKAKTGGVAWLDVSPSGSRSRPKPSKPAKRESLADRVVAAKRAHRLQLSQRAADRWKGAGHAQRHLYLERARFALMEEGFRSTPFQWRHKGHAYGLVKDVGDKQIHVRIYEDGVIDAEIEIHRRYLQHLFSPRPSAHREIKRILDKHGIPTDLVNEKYLPQLGAKRKAYPKGRTKVAHLLGSAAGIVGGVVAVSVARLAMRRIKGRRT